MLIHSAISANSVCQIEKLFDVACSLTDVLSLLPTPNDPFVQGPRDYLTQFLTLLSTLRNGDHRFLPLLLSKVHDVLPRLASPMLQTVPEPSNSIDANIDIFDGFGNAGMGTASVLPAHFENKRIEEIASPNGDGRDNTPFTSPAILTPGMDYQSLGSYEGYQDLGMQRSMSSQNRLARPPMRQESGSSYNVIPRSVPEYQNLSRENSGLDSMNGMGMGQMDMPYR